MAEELFSSRSRALPEIAPDDEILPPQTEHLRMASKRILTKNDFPGVGFSLSINPYNGCTHDSPPYSVEHKCYTAGN
ncbi:MAG: hypothetical protein ACR2IE_01700 [Candidatus Sumerlaeaceae bacterium]